MKGEKHVWPQGTLRERAYINPIKLRRLQLHCGDTAMLISITSLEASVL